MALSAARLFAAYETGGNNLLDSVRNLHRDSIARKGNPIEPRDLALKLSNIATCICRHVSVIDLAAESGKVGSTAALGPKLRSKRQATSSNMEPEKTVEQRLVPIERTFPLFLVHLHTLSQFPGSGNLCGQVIYKFIDIFRVLFQRICDFAVAKERLDQDRTKSTKKKNNRRKKQDSSSSSAERRATSPIIMRLCKLSISMLFHLDPTKFTHKAILEGCIYLLVTRVGEVLKNFTIGERPFGIQDDHTTSRHNQNPREGRQLKGLSAANEVEASGAQAPYLIWILKHAEGLTSSLCPSINAAKTSRDYHQKPETAQPDSARNIMYEDARIRLQHTLVKAVFGERLGASFEPALEPPRAPSDGDLTTEMVTQAETADIGDWFKNEVWRLIGWDVLRGNLAWE